RFANEGTRMIQSLVWKEYREQRAIWMAMAVVNGIGLVVLPRMLMPESDAGLGRTADIVHLGAALFTWIYGLVCGSMLLANETETGMMVFLDILPVGRLQLWLSKVLAGSILLLGQVAVLTGFLIGLGHGQSTEQILGTVLAMLFFGFFGISW